MITAFCFLIALITVFIIYELFKISQEKNRILELIKHQKKELEDYQKMYDSDET